MSFTMNPGLKLFSLILLAQVFQRPRVCHPACDHFVDFLEIEPIALRKSLSSKSCQSCSRAESPVSILRRILPVRKAQRTRLKVRCGRTVSAERATQASAKIDASPRGESKLTMYRQRSDHPTVDGLLCAIQPITSRRGPIAPLDRSNTR